MTDLGRDLERMWIIAIALVGFGFALLGWAIGRSTQPAQVLQQPMCSIEHFSGHPACPPAAGTRVMATWAGGLRAEATWTGRTWVFSEPVLGSMFAREHPIAWSPL